MKFENGGDVFYTKDEYHKEYDDGTWFFTEDYLSYYKGYLIHREDGPACKWADGSKSWYKNGRRDRDDGPSDELPDGSKWWHKNGKYHREDGPTIEYYNGSKFWFLNGKGYSEDEYWKIMNIKRKERILHDI